MVSQRLQRGITLATVVAALAILIVIVGRAHRSETGPSSSAGEKVAPEKLATTHPSRTAALVSTPESAVPGGDSRKAMPNDCKEMLPALYEKVEAWAKTTTDTDSIGDKASCLEAKRFSEEVARHCDLVAANEPAVHPEWCESQSYIHPHVLVLRRERARNKAR